MIKKTLFLLGYLLSLQLAAQERIHLQYDRDQYVPGDTIWFKAFIRKDEKPSFTSHNLYVQLRDINGRPIIEQKLPIIGATASGHLIIPDSLRKPWYVIRAFTPLSVTYDEPYIYKHLLSLSNSSAKKETVTLTIQPEAGLLAENTATKLFIRSMTTSGIPVALNGYLRNSKERTVANFSTKETGTTAIWLTPEKNERYEAVYFYNNQNFSQALPPADSVGISMEIIKESTGYRCRIKRSDLRSQQAESFQLSVKHANNLMFFKEYRLTKEKVLDIPMNLAGNISGFLEFLLENKNGDVLGSRMLLHQTATMVSSVLIDTLAVSLQPRSLNRFRLQFPDSLPRTYAVSVAAIEDKEEKNAPTPILFNMMIPGSFHEDLSATGYPFEQLMNEQIDEEKMNEVLAFYHYHPFKPQKNPLHDPYLIRLSGTVYQPKTQLPFQNGSLSFWLLNDRKQLVLETAVDEAGQFAVDSIVFFGDAKIYWTYTNAKGKIQTANIVMDTVPRHPLLDLSPDYRQWFAKRIDTNRANTNELPPNASGTTLAAVTVFSKIKTPPLVEKYVSERFKYDGTNLFDMTKSNSVAPPLDLIVTKLPGIVVERDRGGTPIRLKSKTYFGYNTGQWDVDLFIDERRCTINDIDALQTQDIALIRYVKTGFPVGAVFVYLKKAEERSVDIPSSASFFPLKGYASLLDFRKIDYTLIENNRELTDQRRTLLWQPGVFLGQNNEDQQIEFYTNQNNKGYRILIEGMDINGRLFRKIWQFKP